MKCPNCNKTLIVNECVLNNVETYRNTVVAKAECCGTGVTVSPNMKYIVEPYEGNDKKDDWGNPITRVNK